MKSRSAWLLALALGLIGSSLPLLADAGNPTLDGPVLRTDLVYQPVDGQNIVVHGLYGFDYQKLKYRRLDPESAQYRPQIVIQSKWPKGARIRFTTNSLNLHVPVFVIKEPDEVPVKLSLTATRGIDIYVNGVFLSSILVKDDEVVTLPRYDGIEFNDIDLYLPSMLVVRVEQIGINKDASIHPPDAFSKKVLFYGTSIEWGGGADRVSLSYPEMLARELKCDHYNFGFRSNGWGEDEMVNTLKLIPADVFVLSYLRNVTPEALEYTKKSYYDNVVHFVRSIKESQPTAKVIVVGPYFYPREAYKSNIAASESEKRKAALRAVNTLVAKDQMEGVFFIDGESVPLHQHNLDGFDDDAGHPNTLGNRQIASRLEPLLRQVLDLQ